ncbi:4-(cytidine 5'-diphospho)-2-C-methyl-D-erythritol kinase [Puia dinghuensis]|uniref:4-diphosphocytidyl-2-C-methyl-D-erythritol kinase n=1 Tax=Puia dinghuensis TaxID=1792502 RepID=A0A8J2XSC1_9BACT|nr:4-(cytidine 5'-diphospho)-2-C-methyl-D-erythritol kinase [Puia dinghuensis]GGA94308.1 4-diphosphocytidyl-2-C-methyl-D-erythritol kinase [Puia dinghuensis]
MVLFPNCKINLGLYVLYKRADGYHDLSTVFYPLPVKDVLEIIRSDTNQFTAYGIPIPGDPTANLCEKAYQLLRKDFPTLPPVHIHLYKNIPIGAGLGGGSADGAFTLLGLNSTFQLGLSPDQLIDYAAQLGSDCPFFILNKPCLGGGRGEQLQPITLDLSAYSFVLVNPGIHISTAQAFSLCTPDDAILPIEDIISQPVHTWKEQLHNDFEFPVFQLHPELREIKTTLYAHGALYASLTGSGSSFYGIFEKHNTPTTLPLSWNYRILP